MQRSVVGLIDFTTASKVNIYHPISGRQLHFRRDVHVSKKTLQAFTAGQASQAAGIEYYQLNRWATLGIVEPSIESGKGYNGVRAYSFSDIIALRVVANVKAAGLSLSKAGKLVKAIQKWDESAPKEYFVVDQDGDVEAFDENDFVTALRSTDRAPLQWFININSIATEVKGGLASHRRSNRGKKLAIA